MRSSSGGEGWTPFNIIHDFTHVMPSAACATTTTTIIIITTTTIESILYKNDHKPINTIYLCVYTHTHNNTNTITHNKYIIILFVYNTSNNYKHSML